MTLTVDARLPTGHSIDRVAFSADAIRDRVRELGREITDAYAQDERLIVIGLLKGSFLFLADLVREVRVPLQVDFLVAASYGKGVVSSGEVQLLYDPPSSLSNRPVLLVEDIVDSGTTLEKLIPRLQERDPKSIEVCTLLHKRLETVRFEPRWVGFHAPNDFLVGYGLDYAEDFRHLPYIASLQSGR